MQEQSAEVVSKFAAQYDRKRIESYQMPIPHDFTKPLFMGPPTPPWPAGVRPVGLLGLHGPARQLADPRACISNTSDGNSVGFHEASELQLLLL